MKKLHCTVLLGALAAALFFFTPALAQEQEQETALKLGLYADTSSRKVVDIRTDGVLRGFLGEPNSADRLFAAQCTGMGLMTIYFFNDSSYLSGEGIIYIYADSSGKVIKSWHTNSSYAYVYESSYRLPYLLHGTYRIMQKRLIFSIPGEPALKTYGVITRGSDRIPPNPRTHPFEGWEGRTFVYSIVNDETFVDDEGNSWIRISE